MSTDAVEREVMTWKVCRAVKAARPGIKLVNDIVRIDGLIAARVAEDQYILHAVYSLNDMPEFLKAYDEATEL